MVRRTVIKSICDNSYGTDEPQAGTYGSNYDPVTKRTYFCGYFSAVGYPVGFVAAVNATTGERRDFPKFTHVFANNTVEGVVNKIISDGDGGYFVAGEFTNVVDPGSTYAQVRYNLTKVNSDLTIDQNFVPIVNSKVRDIIFDGTLLYICGDFTLVNGQARTCFAALNGSTGELDTRAGFNLYVQRFSGGVPTINCMASVGSQLILAGRFDKVNDTFLDNFARINTAPPSLDITFTLNTNNEVRYLVADSTRLTYAGTFTQSNSLSRVRIAQADPPYVTPSDITSFDPAPDGTVNNLVSAGGALYVAGEFTNIAGQSRPAGIAAFVTNAITDLNPSLQTFEGDTSQPCYTR